MCLPVDRFTIAPHPGRPTLVDKPARRRSDEEGGFVNRALLDRDGGPRQVEKPEAPYQPRDWERRLAEARAKRQALLARRDGPPGPATPGTGPPEADTDRPRALWPWPVDLRAAAGSFAVRAFAAGCAAGALLAGAAVYLAMSASEGPEPATAAVASVAAPDLPRPEPLPAAAPSRVAEPAGTDGPAVASGRGPTEAPAQIEGPADADRDAARAPPAPATSAAPGVEPDRGPDDAVSIGILEALTPTLDAGPPAAEAEGPPPPTEAGRVAILVPASVPARDLYGAAGRLRDAGWGAADLRASPFTVSETHVRFYHPEDRSAAEALARSFDARARDFTGNARLPERGTLELWLAGGSGGAPASPG
jgi:hypothetical protein